VRRLVRGRVQVGRPTERDVIASRIRARPHRIGGLLGVTADVALHATHVVATEGLLNSADVRHGTASAGDPGGRRVVHPFGTAVAPTHLNGARGEHRFTFREADLSQLAADRRARRGPCLFLLLDLNLARFSGIT